MSVQVSTGFKRRILGPESFSAIFDGGIITVYSGLQPASADHAVTGTYLGRVTVGGGAWHPSNTAAGLHFLLENEWVVNSPFESWLLLPEATGVAGWFRLTGPDDDDGQPSYTRSRIDGSVGLLPSNTVQMRLINTTLNVGMSVAIESFALTIPPVVL